MELVVIVTEANERVATGHLMECITCVQELMKAGYQVSFWINGDADVRLKERIPCKFQEYQESIERDYTGLVEDVKLTNPKAVLFNLREITEEFILVFKKRVKNRIICIDEYGHRRLSADIIVNPMIDSYYWNYGDSDARIYCGAEYLILDEKLGRLHVREKAVRSKISKIVVTMGGVDPRNYTYSLVQWLPEIFPEASIDIILGGGYRYREEIKKIVDSHTGMAVYENIPDLLERIYEADLVICAGGNTLHETACIGTPAIIIPSMPHEVRTAQCFAKRGFGYVLDGTKSWEQELKYACERIERADNRRSMSASGKAISDGLGRMRIVELVQI